MRHENYFLIFFVIITNSYFAQSATESSSSSLTVPPLEAPSSTLADSATAAPMSEKKNLSSKIWSSPCVRRHNQRLGLKADPKRLLTCVNTVEEIKDKAFSDENYAYTKLALTAVKYFNIDASLFMEGDSTTTSSTPNSTPAKAKESTGLSFKYTSGLILDSCSMAFGKNVNPLVQYLFCDQQRGYRHYLPSKGEGLSVGTFREKNTFVTSFQKQKVPVSLCIRQNPKAMAGGISEGYVVVAVFDLLNFENSDYVGRCLELVTGPMRKSNKVGKPPGTIMQAGIFSEHPIESLRRQEVIKLYLDVAPIKIK